MSGRPDPGILKIPATKITFITGTDTGVGKTVFTANTVHALRQTGVNALAVKPFASGGMEDANELHRALGGALSIGEITPFVFREPLTPMLAARLEGRQVPVQSVVEHLLAISRGCEHLLVEGAGGVLSPLGEGYGLLEIAKEVGGKMVVVGKNRLGVINHALLTIHRIESAKVVWSGVVLMDEVACGTVQDGNVEVLEELSGLPVVRVPHLVDPHAYAETSKNFHKVLVLIFG